jgi:hypothetical protein
MTPKRIQLKLLALGCSLATLAGAIEPNDASSFHVPLRKTCEGRCVAILRPTGSAGKIELKAEADGLKSATVFVKTR